MKKYFIFITNFQNIIVYKEKIEIEFSIFFIIYIFLKLTPKWTLDFFYFELSGVIIIQIKWISYLNSLFDLSKQCPPRGQTL